MLKIIHHGNSSPTDFICDPSATFQPGQVAELTVIGNQVMATVSNGTAPIGVIDDIRTKAFTNISWNETIIVQVPSVLNPSGQLVTSVDVKTELRKPNIQKSSFVSTVKCTLNAINGVITFLAGTPLNIDISGGGTFDGIKAIVNYTYQVGNIPGDDSTLGSGRVTVWYERMFMATDQYETNQQYPVRANLFVSEVGLFTTRKPSSLHPCIALVTGPPSSTNPYLSLMWL